MLQDYNIVIADASCFILLDKINEFAFLQKLFTTVATTQDIADEYGKELPNWIEIKQVKDYQYQLLLQLEVDSGEASAIALCMEQSQPLLIADDGKARKLATKLNLKLIGTFGVIVAAKQAGAIASVKPIIEKIRMTNFRYSEKIFNEILMLAGE